MAASKALIVPAVKRHTSTVIVAHGLGDSGAGWIFLAETFRRRSLFQETKFVFPNAPNIPITVNMGMRMPGWYDILDFGDLQNRTDDEPGILRSQKVFHDLIDEEVKNGIPSDRIVLGGFSQGGAMSLLSGVLCEKKLGGIFGLSCYLLMFDKIRDMLPAGNPNAKTPIFIGHGDSDPLVKPRWGEASAKQLKDWGYPVEMKMYPGLPHSAAPEEIDDLEKWLHARIPEVGDKSSSTSL